MEIIFWSSFLGIFYAYFGYPILLFIVGLKEKKQLTSYCSEYEPTVSIIVPVYNEEAILDEKIQNTFSLSYPQDRMQIIIISDGSTDNTKQIVERYLDGSNIEFIESIERKGKANALNLGLENATSEIIVFSDASIMLDRDALKNIVIRFQDGDIGCISGEDHIPELGGEGVYGRYELFIRNQESRIHSIVGASGSFYAQRKHLCTPFIEGMAPDFLSVLHVVEMGSRAITEPNAFGSMSSIKTTRGEFQRKVRTLIRGMAALFYKKQLLNLFRYGIFSIELISHKLIRWFVPFLLITLFLANAFLLYKRFYLIVFIIQILFYTLAVLALFRNRLLYSSLLARIPLYFLTVNVAILYAWIKFATGVRQEIWSPSKR